jgi:hypothetical protein
MMNHEGVRPFFLRRMRLEIDDLQPDVQLFGPSCNKIAIGDDYYARQKMLTGEHHAQIRADACRLPRRDGHQRRASFRASSVE